MPFPPIGAQLLVFSKKYSINDDIDAILDCLAAAGYDGVEGGPRDEPAAYWKKLQDRGLRFGGGHTGPKELQNPRPLIEYLHAVGTTEICNSGLLEWNERTAGDYRATIAVLNQAGKQLRAEGIHLHYHNHEFEFEKVDGDRTGMDLLMDGLDPDACDFCFDIAWVQKGGHDPAEFLLAHRDRTSYLHFKDFDDHGWIELGQGKVNFHSVMQALPQLTRVKWVMIEQDTTQIEPMESAAISRKYLKDTFGY